MMTRKSTTTTTGRNVACTSSQTKLDCHICDFCFGMCTSGSRSNKHSCVKTYCWSSRSTSRILEKKLMTQQPAKYIIRISFLRIQVVHRLNHSIINKKQLMYQRIGNWSSGSCYSAECNHTGLQNSKDAPSNKINLSHSRSSGIPNAVSCHNHDILPTPSRFRRLLKWFHGTRWSNLLIFSQIFKLTVETWPTLNKGAVLIGRRKLNSTQVIVQPKDLRCWIAMNYKNVRPINTLKIQNQIVSLDIVPCAIR